MRMGFLEVVLLFLLLCSGRGKESKYVLILALFFLFIKIVVGAVSVLGRKGVGMAVEGGLWRVVLRAAADGRPEAVKGWKEPTLKVGRRTMGAGGGGSQSSGENSGDDREKDDEWKEIGDGGGVAESWTLGQLLGTLRRWWWAKWDGSAHERCRSRAWVVVGVTVGGRRR